MNYLFLIVSFIWAAPQQADMLLVNGRVYTVDSAFHLTQAIAVRDGRILATGSTQEILSNYESDRILDLQGKTVLPGFNDGHCHFLNYGLYSGWAQLYGLTSMDEVLDVIADMDTSLTAGWIIGRGWDQNLWSGKAFPDCRELDRLYPNTPVYLVRVDGHAALVNTYALKLAGIDKHTQVNGGKVFVEGDHCTGLLLDNAMDLFDEILPDKDPQVLSSALQKAQQDCFAYGLTSVTDAGLEKYQVDAVIREKQTGTLPVRMNIMLTPSQENVASFLMQGPKISDNLVIRSLKVYADGALGSRGAALMEPYSDDPFNSGLLLIHPDSLNTLAALCASRGYQMCTHAIGDSANRLALKTYAAHIPAGNDLRWRVEHCQVVNPEDLHYFQDYQILPSVQSTHATSDMYWVEERLGPERVKYAYAYQDMLEAAGVLINGTDFPVEQIDPLLTFYAAVARMDQQRLPSGGFQTENALTRIDAIRSMTIWPAYGSFEESVKGSIEPGKFADLVVLDKDIMSMPYPEIIRARVVMTILNGEVVFTNEQAD